MQVMHPKCSISGMLYLEGICLVCALLVFDGSLLGSHVRMMPSEDERKLDA